LNDYSFFSAPQLKRAPLGGNVMTWRSFLLHQVWTPPERRWWGGTVFVALGTGMGIWFWRTSGWAYGLAVAVAALLLEAILFRLLVRRRRSSTDVAA
jgi:integral membrane sensor domain MASE1